MILAMLFPNLISAQQVPPHIIVGAASNNGIPVPTGTTISALIDGTKIGTARPAGSGNFTLMAGNSNSYEGKTMSFSIGDSSASETLVWKKGEATNISNCPRPFIVNFCSWRMCSILNHKNIMAFT